MSVLQFPARLGTVQLTSFELHLLANAIEIEAGAHDKRIGSCPAELRDSMERVRQLRALAERMREGCR